MGTRVAGADGSPNSDGLWLTADGPLAESPTDTGKELARTIGSDGVSYYLFFSDLNAFAYIAGQSAAFTWL